MNEALAVILIVVASTTLGVTLLLSYMVTRLMSNLDWDKSNITNALRLLSHVVLHPNDFGKMHYITPAQHAMIEQFLPETAEQIRTQKPFWYVGLDELSQVVRTRP